ncbi:hypothetical protein HNQ59_001118 [Chitinivorax tropicus]|uniref:Uncharacterized protein n=1 Tax=Chitinivorax tropicus TaxID=714531 RepID=A0A840MGS2_9PROT|nr:hypothetical protein [Chitinivorax tropicus]
MALIGGYALAPVRRFDQIRISIKTGNPSSQQGLTARSSLNFNT